MIRTQRAHLNVEAQSHAGMTGKNNEDRYAVASFVLDPNNQVPVLFAVLADGIGGHRAGEVAAELAVNHIMQVVAKSDGQDIRSIIVDAVTEASDAIAAHSESNENLNGMGSTCAVAWIIGDQLHTAYVGDSRIYLMRDGRIQQVTVDHSWVQEAIDKGIITPEMARDHPNVHVIRRYLGSPEPPDPDFRLKLFEAEGDPEAEKNQGMKSNLKESARALIDLANARGGHDNTTIVLISVPSDFKLVVKKNRKKTDWLPWVIGGVAGTLFLLLAASILTFGLLKRNATTLTPTVSPTLLFTTTPTPTITPLPTFTIVPTRSLPIAPTYTPWPTNTAIP